MAPDFPLCLFGPTTGRVSRSVKRSTDEAFRNEDEMRLKYLIDISVCALLLGSGLCHAQDGGALKLWYRQPAGAWTQALPVGNGRLAAMVFGTVRKEHIQLNEGTAWSGEKRDRSNPEAPQALAQIRGLLVEGHPAQAQALADKTMISIPRALPVYETLGDLWLDFGSGPDATDYRRELDLDSTRSNSQACGQQHSVLLESAGRTRELFQFRRRQANEGNNLRRNFPSSFPAISRKGRREST
jgi:hypothetical protein